MFVRPKPGNTIKLIADHLPMLTYYFIRRDGSTPPHPDSDWDFAKSIVTKADDVVVKNGEVVWKYRE